MSNIFTLFSRANLNANLTPTERAILRFLGSLLWGALIAGAQAVLPLFSSPTLDLASIQWGSVLHTFLVTAVMAFALGVSKYHTAQGDPALPATSSTTPAPAAAAPVAAPAAAPVADAAAMAVAVAVGDPAADPTAGA